MPSSHSEVKAGAFVALSLALLFVMVFVVGDCAALLRGSQEREVLFSSVTGLQSNSAVNYAGVEIGRVRETRIEEIDAKILKKLPPITTDNLDRLPLSFDEVEKLKGLKDPASIDAAARRLIGPGEGRRGRKMIVLVLEINRSEEFTFRQDDVVRLATTVMGDSTVEVSPGSGKALAAGEALLGDGSNLFTQLSDSMREIRTLLSKVSGIIGEEERVNIKATVANVKKASEDLSLAAGRARGLVKDSEKPVKQALADLRAGMSEARTAIAEVRKTVTEVRPKVVAALDSGKKMMESGRKAADSADKLMVAARPKVLAAMDESTTAARAATAALKEMEGLLVETGDTLDENRPAVRRALADLREAGRNFKEMSARLKRQPWLLLKKPRGTQDVILLESAARALGAASADLAASMQYLEKISADPARAARIGGARAGDLIKEIRAIGKELSGRRENIEKKLKELERKGGGRYLKRAREKADREK